MVPQTQREQLLDIAQGRGVVTTRDVEKAGIHRQELTRLVRDGKLERIERGRYRLPEGEISEFHGLVEAAAAVPQGVICLLSALYFHDLGTQIPPQVWIAIQRGSHKPEVDRPPLHVVRFSGCAFSEGIETHTLEGRRVRIYSVAKTVADAFKYRNKIGLDVALEALRETWRDQRATMEEIEHFARICRVSRVMRPYLEALVA